VPQIDRDVPGISIAECVRALRMTSRSRWRALRAAGSIVLAAAALYAILVKVDPTTLWAACRQVDGLWGLAGLASVLLTLALVTTRWRLLLGSGRAPVRLLWDAVVIGQAANILLPLRFGEGARIAVTASKLNRSAGGVTVAVAVERALDVAAFGATVLLLVAAGRMPQAFERAAPALMIVGLGTVGAVLAAVRLMPALLGWLRSRLDKDSRMARWLARQEGGAGSAWADIARGRRLLFLVALTALILLSSASTNFLIFRAFNLDVPPVAALVLLAVLQVGTAVVSVPGNIGVFHYLTVMTLATWQVPAPHALAAAIVLHVVSLGPKVLLGAAAAANLHLREKAR
jgi:uncharacterized protein (TIRG00374 family)